MNNIPGFKVYSCLTRHLPLAFFLGDATSVDNAVLSFLQEKSVVDENNILAKKLSDKGWGYVHNNGIDLGIPVGGQNEPRELCQGDYGKYGRGL